MKTIIFLLLIEMIRGISGLGSKFVIIAGVRVLGDATDTGAPVVEMLVVLVASEVGACVASIVAEIVACLSSSSVR